MKFSLWPMPNQPWDHILRLARHVEATGWDGIWYADHFMPNSEDTSVPWPEAWTTLTALAASVPRLRIGPLVMGNTYRHPAVLAKMAATLDHISGGRLVLGIGAGWQENEHRQYGIPFHNLATRLRMLDESCQVIKSLFAQRTTNFSGHYYSLRDASLEPKPLQDRLPLLIGGGGERVTLKIVAKYADEWNVWGTVDTLKKKMAILDQHCADCGRDPTTIHRTAVALLFMSENSGELAAARASSTSMPAIIGTSAEVRDIVAAYEAAGVGELIVPDFTMDNLDRKIRSLDLFITEIAGR